MIFMLLAFFLTVYVHGNTAAGDIPDDTRTSNREAISRDKLFLSGHEFDFEEYTSPSFSEINVVSRKLHIFWLVERLCHRFLQGYPVPIFGKFSFTFSACAIKMTTTTWI